MENTSTLGAATGPASPTRLDLIARGGCASPAYLDVERTLDRARSMLDTSGGGGRNPAGPPIAAYRALATRLTAHAEKLFRDPGLTVSLSTWSSDYVRLTYRLLLTYARQAEERIRMLVRTVRS